MRNFILFFFICAVLCCPAAVFGARPVKVASVASAGDLAGASGTNAHCSALSDMAFYFAPKIRHFSSSHHSSGSVHHSHSSMHYHYHSYHNSGYANSNRGYGGYSRERGNSVAGICSVILGSIGLACILVPSPVDALIALCFCTGGILCGIVGIPHKLRGIAIAGLIISAVSFLAILALAAA